MEVALELVVIVLVVVIGMIEEWSVVEMSRLSSDSDPSLLLLLVLLVVEEVGNPEEEEEVEEDPAVLLLRSFKSNSSDLHMFCLLLLCWYNIDVIAKARRLFPHKSAQIESKTDQNDC
jgi:hypothetical protein